MVTVGYGDIVASNDLEKGIAIMIMLIGSGVFAYSLNSIGDIMNEIKQNDKEMR